MECQLRINPMMTMDFGRKCSVLRCSVRWSSNEWEINVRNHVNDVHVQKKEQKYIFSILWFQYVKTLVASIQYVIFFFEEAKIRAKKIIIFLINILLRLSILHSFQSTSPLSFESNSPAKTQERRKTKTLSAPTTRKEQSNAKKKKKGGRIKERS